MMELLVFLVILFGLFGVLATQYINQYRTAYYVWVKETIFNETKKNTHEKLDLCSKIESYSRELCEINDLFAVVLFMLCVTLTVFLVIIGYTLNYMGFNIDTFSTNGVTTFGRDDKIQIITILASLILTVLIFFAIPIVLYFLKFFQSNTIDKKLFDVWWANKCHRCKDEKNKKNMQPIRFYELLDENIKNGNLTDFTDDEKELVKKLTKTNVVNINP